MGESIPKIARNLMYVGSIILAAAALILLLYVGYEALLKPEIFSFVWLAIVLVLVAFVIYLIAAIISAIRIGSEAKQRFAGYQLVCFLILVFSLLAFALHHREGESHQVIAPQQTSPSLDNTGVANTQIEQHPSQAHPALDTTRNVAEMAAIMVLFLLAELAAFVAHDVTQAKTLFETLGVATSNAARDIGNAANNIGENLQGLNETTTKIKQLRLVANVASLHPDVLDETIDLVRAWGGRVPAPTISEDPKSTSEQDLAVSNLCWRILLKEYLNEELSDIAPSTTPFGKTAQWIPASVRPVDIRDTNVPQQVTDTNDVSFMATTVGFYARFLATLVEDLSKAAEGLPKVAGESQKLCMAIVTNMLPAHCWNWPMPDKNWRSYDPINSYRESMLNAVEKGAQIDRVLLVYEDPNVGPNDVNKPEFYAAHEAQGGYFWRWVLLDQMLKNWYILSPREMRDDKDDRLPCSENFAEEHGQLGREALALFPPPIQCAAKQKTGSGRVYPMIINDSPDVTFTDYPGDVWQSKKLAEEYNALHGENGMYWRLPLNDDSLGLLNGRHDIMFIGIGRGNQDNKGLWTDIDSCDWGVCLMSSMNPTTETMFLTIISGEGVRVHYNWCKKQLDAKMNWTVNRLNPKNVAPQANA